MDISIFLADTINSFLQSLLFISTINLFSKDEFKKPKSKMFLYIFLLWAMISLSTLILGNSSFSTLILHLIILIFGGIIYKNDLLAASIGFSLVYAFIFITLLISSFIYTLLSSKISFLSTNNMFFILIMYFPQYIISFFIFYKKQSMYLIYKTIKSRNSSIIYLILFTIVLDFIISFNSITNAKNNPIFKEIVLILLFIFIIFIIIYSSNIEKKSKEIQMLNSNLEENIKSLKKLKHDYGSQISYLYGLHLMGNHDKLGELLKNIIDGHDNIVNNIVMSKDNSNISMIVNTINLKDITVFIDENADLLDTNVNELDFQRIVSNILRNSVEALHGSGSIKINTYYSFNYFVLKIQNNGPKIPKKILDKIFDNGFTTKENKESNNGFGLAIVKELVESYNGKIQVSSTDKFTEFTIFLPTIK
ncbi:ATP-binding protein [Clostridium perfringens]|uniref:sensor histidine kinase n=1 Tax=Clostridium perfringens TaxID=1502 RepID=UPI002973F6F2|nr:ATP-binding protein [Clostridium perfringens]MDM0476327.1 ATP-binding protein [Clostridium perfringens]MDM0480369.1 ATP-binding protein [Clostridium perfringens]MDM0485533.1 ATP-binding protein [Clostridium perfringens]MDM0487736.1 ATP-binding protein [Clostridium perfringens]